MTPNRIGASWIKRGLFLAARLRLRARLDMLLAGLAQSIDRNCYWFRSYVTLTCAANFIYIFIAQTLPDFNLAAGIAFNLVGMALITVILAWGRQIYHLNRQQRFAQLVITFAVVASLSCIAVLALFFGQITIIPLLAGMVACGIASIPMFFILILPDTAFNPDFAHLGMFRRYQLILELGSGLFLFVVVAQQLRRDVDPVRSDRAVCANHLRRAGRVAVWPLWPIRHLILT